MKRRTLAGRIAALLAGLCVSIWLAPTPARAQAVSGTMLGTVKD